MTRFVFVPILRAAYLSAVAALVLGRVAPVAAQTVALKSLPRDYAVYSVTKNGRRVPKFVVRVDTYVYPPQTTCKQFLTMGVPRTPEEVLARLVELRTTQSPDADAHSALYAPEDRRTAKDVKELRGRYLALRSEAGKLGEPKLQRRFDFGNYSQFQLSFSTIEGQKHPDKNLLLAMIDFEFTVSAIERRGDRAYPTKHIIPPGDASWVGQSAFSRQPLGGRETTLPYSLRVPNDSPATMNLHPVDVFFDGMPLNLPLDGKTHTPNEAANFLQHAARVVRQGQTPEILKLWNAPSAKEIRASLRPRQPTQGNYEEMNDLLSDASRRLAFAMEFDEGAIVFLRNRPLSGHKAAFSDVWLDKENGSYKLFTPVSTWSRLGAIGNISSLFATPYFQTYLLQISTATPKKTR